MEDDTDAYFKRNQLPTRDSKLPTEGFCGVKISMEDFENPFAAYPQCTSSVRGICLLINQKEFDLCTNQERRDGTDIDADAVERLFKRLRYKVERVQNINKLRLRSLMMDKSQMDHSKYDSFVCVILSHGSEGTIFATDGVVEAESITKPFRGDSCPTLVGKPKLFFIQACRGSYFDKGARIVHDAATGDAGDILINKVPNEADFLVANSTTPGYYAWRNSSSGSWFIQQLCKVLTMDADSKYHHDLSSLLILVARRVGYLYESVTGQPETHAMKQMTSTSSTLTRLCYLTGPPPKLAAQTNPM